MRQFMNDTELDTWIRTTDMESKINFLVRQAWQNEKYCLACKIELKEADATQMRKIKHLGGYKKKAAMISGGASVSLLALIEFIKWLWPK